MTILRYVGNIAFVLLGLLITGLVLMRSGMSIPPGGWFFTSLIVTAGILVGGEILIKKLALADFGAKVARVAFVFAALVVALTGISQIWSGTLPGTPGVPNWFSNLSNTIGWFGIVTVAVSAVALAVGGYRYTKLPGNISAYLFVTVVACIIFFGGLYVIGLLVAPLQTQVLLDAAQASIQQGADGLTTITSPYGHRTIDWQAIGELNWGKFFGILFFGICVIGFGVFLLKGHKIATFLFVVTASALVLPTAFYYSWTNVVPEPVQTFVSDAAGTVVEANPFLGEKHEVNLHTALNGRMNRNGIGPNDSVEITISGGCSIDWIPTPSWLSQYGGQPWYDPTGYYLQKIAGGSGRVRTYEFTERFKEGLRQANATLDLEIWQVCQ